MKELQSRVLGIWQKRIWNHEGVLSLSLSLSLFFPFHIGNFLEHRRLLLTRFSGRPTVSPAQLKARSFQDLIITVPYSKGRCLIGLVLQMFDLSSRTGCL